MALGAFFSRLKEGLSRSTQKLTEGITTVFKKRRLDEEALEELEELLISADLGPSVAARVIASFRRTRFGKEVTDEEVRDTLSAEIAEILAPVAIPLEIDRALKPHVVLVVGVNGTGKTTTIGKLAQFYTEQGLSVLMVAGDTFRAAAVEQLQVWGERTGCAVMTGLPDSDSAALAFDALTLAKYGETDLLLIDTAGRLHNKSVLMEELRKIIRVIRKVDATAPHSVLLVLDAWWSPSWTAPPGEVSWSRWPRRSVCLFMRSGSASRPATSGHSTLQILRGGWWGRSRASAKIWETSPGYAAPMMSPSSLAAFSAPLTGPSSASRATQVRDTRETGRQPQVSASPLPPGQTQAKPGPSATRCFGRLGQSSTPAAVIR
jgi:fused signal recognition particle receptor